LTHALNNKQLQYDISDPVQLVLAGMLLVVT